MAIFTQDTLDQASTTMIFTREEFEESLDKQIAVLTARPDKILQVWMNGEGLFRFLLPFDSQPIPWKEAWQCGCPTTVKRGERAVYRNEQFTNEIRTMGLPCRPEDIRVYHFPLFKDVQLKWYDVCKKKLDIQ